MHFKMPSTCHHGRSRTFVRHPQKQGTNKMPTKTWPSLWTLLLLLKMTYLPSMGLLLSSEILLQ